MCLMLFCITKLLRNAAIFCCNLTAARKSMKMSIADLLITQYSIARKSITRKVGGVTFSGVQIVSIQSISRGLDFSDF